MPGHIYKRAPGSWTVVVDLGRDPISGRRKQVSRAVKGTRRDAEARLVQLLHERDGGIDVDPGRLTVGEYLERWLHDFARHGVSRRTGKRYEGIVRQHLIPAFGRVLIAKLRPAQIQAYYADALRRGRVDGSGGLSARTVLHHHRVLREAFHHAVRWRVLARNPVDGVEPPRPSRPEMHVLDASGVRHLLGACSDADLHALVFVAVTTGLRQGELLALRWSDVDLAGGSLQVVRSLQYLGREGLRFAEPKTARSRRRLALSPDTVAALGEHRRRQLARRLALGPAYEDQDLVFPDPLGRPEPPPRISHRFGALVRRAGAGPMRFHDLRHTHATLLLQTGVHPKIVSERLGHTSVSITLDTYSHVLPGLQEQAVRLLDGILQQLPAGERLANG